MSGQAQFNLKYPKHLQPIVNNSRTYSLPQFDTTRRYNQRHDAMCSISFLILVDSFSFHHSIYFLQILYDTTGKLNGWCGGSKKNKPVWEATISIITQNTTPRFQHLYLNVCKETKKEAHKQCAEEVQAFGIRL